MNQKNNEQQFNLSEMQQALTLLIWKKGDLREEIMKNPKATIEKELGVKFDEHIKINIVNHANSNQVTFVLPYDIHKAVGKELNDSQLEAIAGGLSLQDVKGFARGLAKGVNLSESGTVLGDKFGDAVIKLGGKFGLQLPELNICARIGGNAGGMINKLLEE